MFSLFILPPEVDRKRSQELLLPNRRGFRAWQASFFERACLVDSLSTFRIVDGLANLLFKR